MTTIRVSTENSKKIIELKQKYNFKNANDVITHLLKVNKEYEKAKIVRIIE